MGTQINYRLSSGEMIEIEVDDAVAAFLQQSDKRAYLQTKCSNKNCVSLELLKNREHRVLQSGRRRDKPYGGELYVDYRAEPDRILRDREILHELEIFEEDNQGNGNKEF